MKNTFLLLGTNLGNRFGNLDKACEMINQAVGKVQLKSKVYESEAWGKTAQPSFLNQVLQVSTKLSPEAVLNSILNIEAQIGRVRKEKWGPRLIDIDILYYQNLCMDTEELTIPHPEIQNRRFTLMPLIEIAPDFIHPRLKLNHKVLLENCTDKLGVKPVLTRTNN